jgi:hypothetical protein
MGLMVPFWFAENASTVTQHNPSVDVQALGHFPDASP